MLTSAFRAFVNNLKFKMIDETQVENLLFIVQCIEWTIFKIKFPF